MMSTADNKNNHNVINPLWQQKSNSSRNNYNNNISNNVELTNIGSRDEFSPQDFFDPGDDSDDDDDYGNEDLELNDEIQTELRQSIASGVAVHGEMLMEMMRNKEDGSAQKNQNKRFSKVKVVSPLPVPPECQFPTRNYLTTYNGHTQCVKAIDVYIPAGLSSTSNGRKNSEVPTEANGTGRKTNSPPREVMVVTGSTDGICRVWYAVSGIEHSALRNDSDPGAVQCLKIVNNQTSGSTNSDQGTSSVSDSSSSCCSNDCNSNSPVFLLVGGENNNIAVWDLFGATILRTLKGGHNWFVSCLAVTPPVPLSVAEHQLISANMESASSSPVQATTATAITTPCGDSVRRSLILSCSYDKLMQAWDLNSGTKLFALGPSGGFRGSLTLKVFTTSSYFFPGEISSAAPRRGSKSKGKSATDHRKPRQVRTFAMVGTFDNLIVVYDLLERRRIASFVNVHKEMVLSLDVIIRSIAMDDMVGEEEDNNGKDCAIAMTGGRDGTAAVWCATNGQLLLQLGVNEKKGHIYAVALVPSDRGGGGGGGGATEGGGRKRASTINTVRQPAATSKFRRTTVGINPRRRSSDGLAAAGYGGGDISGNVSGVAENVNNGDNQHQDGDDSRYFDDVQRLKSATQGYMKMASKMVKSGMKMMSVGGGRYNGPGMMTDEEKVTADAKAAVLKAAKAQEREYRELAEAYSCLMSLMGIVASKDGYVDVYDLGRNYRIRHIPVGGMAATTSLAVPAMCVRVCFVPACSAYSADGSADNCFTLYRNEEDEVEEGQVRNKSYCDSYRDDLRIFTGSADGSVMKYDLRSPQECVLSGPHAGWVNVVKIFRPCDSMIATQAIREQQRRQQQQQQMQQHLEGKEERGINNEAAAAAELDLSKEWIVSASNNQLSIWEMPSANLKKTMTVDPDEDVATMFIHCDLTDKEYTQAMKQSFRHVTESMYATLSKVDRDLYDDLFTHHKVFPPCPIVIVSCYSGKLSSWCFITGRKLVSFVTDSIAYALDVSITQSVAATAATTTTTGDDDDDDDGGGGDGDKNESSARGAVRLGEEDQLGRQLTLFVGCKNSSIHKYDLITGQRFVQPHCASRLNHTKYITGLALMRVEEQYCTCSSTFTAASGEKNSSSIRTLVVSSSLDRSVLVWDANTLALVKHFPKGVHADNIQCMTVHTPVPGRMYGSTKAMHSQTCCSQNLIITASADAVVVVRRLGQVDMSGATCTAAEQLIQDTSSDEGSAGTFWSEEVDDSVVHKIKTKHSGGIQAVAIYDPNASDTHDLFNYPTGEPSVLLVVGSVDGSICVYCLHSATFMNMFQNVHSNHIRSLCVYTPADTTNGPFVVSSSKDKTVKIRDLYYPSALHIAPPCATAEAFDQDMKDSPQNMWPRLSAYFKDHGPCLFLESRFMFLEAIARGRTDFVLRFRDAFKQVLPYLHTPDAGCALCVVVANKNIDALRVVLSCWSEILNTDMKTAADQLFLHPYNHLNVTMLIKIAEWMPREFVDFIASLAPVFASPMLIRDVKYAQLNEKYRNLVVCCSTRDMPHLWDKILKDEDNDDTEEAGQAVIPMTLPLRFAASVSVLSSYVAASQQLESAEIFDSEVGQLVLRYCWDAYGRDEYKRLTNNFALFWFFYCLSFYGFMYAEHGRLGPNPELSKILAIVLALIPYCFSFRKFWVIPTRGIIQLLNEQKRKSEAGISMSTIDVLSSITQRLVVYFTDIWNITEVALHVCFQLATVVRVSKQKDDKESRVLLAMTSVLMVFRVLYYLRPVPGAGPLVAMIIRIVLDIRVFFIILTTLLFTFSQAFHVLAASEPGSSLSPFRAGFYMWRNFLAALGTYDTDAATENTVSPPFSYFLLSFFLIFVVVILLNFLIALMGDSFNKASATAMAEWRRTQAAILVEIAVHREMPPLQPCLQILVYTADVSQRRIVRDGKTMSLSVSSANHENGKDNNGDQTNVQVVEVASSNSETTKALEDLNGRMEGLEKRIEAMATNFEQVLAKLYLQEDSK